MRERGEREVTFNSSPPVCSMISYVLVAFQLQICGLISGILRNTRPLNYTESHSYVLTVAAVGCGLGLRSQPLLVIVEVVPPCRTGWNKGMASSVNYVPSTGPQPLFPQAEFSVCPEEACDVEKVRATMEMETRYSTVLLKTLRQKPLVHPVSRGLCKTGGPETLQYDFLIYTHKIIQTLTVKKLNVTFFQVVNASNWSSLEHFMIEQFKGPNPPFRLRRKGDGINAPKVATNPSLLPPPVCGCVSSLFTLCALH